MPADPLRTPTVVAAAALALSALGAAPAAAQRVEPGQVRSWNATTQLEVRKTETEGDETRTWSLKARGAFSLPSAGLAGGIHHRWATADPSLATDRSTLAFGDIELSYRARRARTGAHNPGGTLDCVFIGRVPYGAMALAMPGMPVGPMGGAKPHLPAVLKCKGTGDYPPDSEERPELPLNCGEPQALTQANGGLAQVTQCQAEGFDVQYRFQLMPGAR